MGKKAQSGGRVVGMYSWVPDPVTSLTRFTSARIVSAQLSPFVGRAVNVKAKDLPPRNLTLRNSGTSNPRPNPKAGVNGSS